MATLNVEKTLIASGVDKPFVTFFQDTLAPETPDRTELALLDTAMNNAIEFIGAKLPKIILLADETIVLDEDLTQNPFVFVLVGNNINYTRTFYESLKCNQETPMPIFNRTIFDIGIDGWAISRTSSLLIGSYRAHARSLQDGSVLPEDLFDNYKRANIFKFINCNVYCTPLSWLNLNEVSYDLTERSRRILTAYLTVIFYKALEQACKLNKLQYKQFDIQKFLDEARAIDKAALISTCETLFNRGLNERKNAVDKRIRDAREKFETTIRAYRFYTNEIQYLEKEQILIKDLQQTLPNFQHEFDRLCKAYPVTFDSEESIKVTLPEIEIAGISFGVFTITINLRDGHIIAQTNSEISAASPHGSYFYHPHVNDTRICFGNLADLVGQKLALMKLKETVDLIYIALSSYNAKGAYCQLSAFARKHKKSQAFINRLPATVLGKPKSVISMDEEDLEVLQLEAIEMEEFEPTQEQNRLGEEGIVSNGVTLMSRDISPQDSTEAQIESV